MAISSNAPSGSADKLQITAASPSVILDGYAPGCVELAVDSPPGRVHKPWTVDAQRYALHTPCPQLAHTLTTAAA